MKAVVSSLTRVDRNRVLLFAAMTGGVIGLVVAWMITNTITPLYRSSAILELRMPMKSYKDDMEIAKSPEVFDIALDKLGHAGASPSVRKDASEKLRASLEIGMREGTDLIEIKASHRVAAEAQRIVLAIVKSYEERWYEMNNRRISLDEQWRLKRADEQKRKMAAYREKLGYCWRYLVEQERLGPNALRAATAEAEFLQKLLEEAEVELERIWSEDISVKVVWDDNVSRAHQAERFDASFRIKFPINQVVVHVHPVVAADPYYPIRGLNLAVGMYSGMLLGLAVSFGFLSRTATRVSSPGSGN